MSKKSIKPQKVVLIVGLSRSGSTLLDRLLGCQNHMIGLGEIYEVFRPEWKQYQGEMDCTCGKRSSSCEFWSPMFSWLRNNGQASIESKYQHCITAFSEQFSEEYVLIDSSKNITALHSLLKISDIDLKVIYLIRDVRSWVVSRLEVRNNHPENFKKGGYYVRNLQYNLGLTSKIFAYLIPWLTKCPAYYYLIWHYQNRKIRKTFSLLKQPYFQISYEALAINPRPHLKSLIEFITDQPVADVNISLTESASHIVNGNPKRNNKRPVVYDHRWLKCDYWLWGYLALPWVRNFNKEQVYNKLGLQNKDD